MKAVLTKTNKRKYCDLKKTFSEKKCYSFFKRLFDIVFSVLGIIITSPIMLVLYLIIKLDGGPAIYKQKRVGKNEKEFTIYKFRSMVQNADSPELIKQLTEKNEMDGPMFKMKNDPRVTKIGSLIRKTSLDELPQFFNILIGNMTFVGPRPPLPTEVEVFDDYQKQKLLVKQGLTCYWQCSGRNNIMFDEWIELDLKYIKERGAVTDFKILIKTIPAVLSRKGAQ